ncbi:MAG: chemotaxis protein CheW [Lachnospiraceae bacterium]|nr:chemotaxis protein CheW [Lachnospiraceae bacterium]
METGIETAAGVAKQYIVVEIGNEQYGIDIGYVDNIVRMQEITRVPKSQIYFKGIINLRGEIVPIMSIRTRMGLEDDVFTNSTRIIILKLEQQGKFGIIVDEVREVVTLNADKVERTNMSVKEGRESFINGIGKNGEDLISLLDLNSIIEEDDNV